MYLRVERSGASDWLLNGGTIGVSLNRNNYFHQWMKENTNAYNGKSPTEKDVSEGTKEVHIIQSFMFAGFTPIYECFGTKILDGSAEEKYELSDDIRWFLFDGISGMGTYANDLLSIAVSWNKKNNTFTVYDNRYINKKRIGVLDEMDYVFNLVDGYLPVKIEDRSRNDFCLDWRKIHNCAAFPGMESSLGEIRSADISDDIFEKRLGNIINHVIKNVEYFTNRNQNCGGDGVVGLCGYKRDELKNHLITSEDFDKEHAGVVRFYFVGRKDDEPCSIYEEDSWIEFWFEDEYNIRISMYDCMQSGSACCVESIRVKRRVTQVNKDYTSLLYGRKSVIDTKTMSVYGNSHSLEEEALAYLPHLGVYTMEDMI